MNCETARQLLPWWLNQTLEPTEREAIDRHLESCEECRRELADTRVAAAVYGAHVSTADLVAHAYGDEPEIDRDTLERHLASCPDCAEELALVRASHQALAGDEAAGGVKNGAEDRSQPPPADFAAARARRAARPAHPGFWRPAALAASLAGLLFLGGWWGTWLYGTGKQASYEAQIGRLQQEIAQLEAAPAGGGGETAREIERLEEELAGVLAAQRQVEERIASQESEIARLSQPSVATIVDLYADRRLRGDPGAEPVIPKQQADRVVLILNTELAPGTSGLRFEVTDAGGRVLASGSGLEVGRDGFLAPDLPRRLLPAGALTLRLVGSGGEVLESYPFRVE